MAVSAAIAQTITVISPNGRENWAQGSQKTITWRSAGVTGNVRILLIQGSANVGIVRDDVPVTLGSINWTVGNYQGGTAAPDSNYRIRIKKMQTDIMDSSDGTFTIGPPETAHMPTTPPAPPQSPSSITVTSPNGGETWLLKVLGPNTASVNWTVSHLGGNANVILKKGGNPVRSITVPIGGSCQFSYAGVAEGDDYRIRVENTDRTFGDESDRDFSIKRETRTPRVVTPAFMVLSILDFKLNNGAERTESRTVTMNHSVRGTPTHYRWKNEGMSDWSPWTSYSGTEPKAEIPQSCGGHTVRFQVKNADVESGVAEDTINYIINREVTVSASDAKSYCGSDWVFRITRRDCIDVYEPSCALLNSGQGLIVCELSKVQLAEVPLGYTAEYQIFAGRFLKEGWTFVSSEWEYAYHDFVTGESVSSSNPEKGCSLLMAPSAGQRGIAHSIRLWINMGQRGWSQYTLKSLTLRGPCDQPVSEAFR
jgi:hypothetical protein